jgi:hypothetical protein
VTITSQEFRKRTAVAVAYRTGSDPHAAIEAAVASATRVHVTPEIERAIYAELGAAQLGYHHSAVRRGLRAAFEAAGFEVVE